MVQVNMTDLPPECHIEHSVTIYKEKKLRAKNKAFVGKLCSVLEMDVAISSGLEVEEIIQSHYATKILTDKLVLDGSARPQNCRIRTRRKTGEELLLEKCPFFFFVFFSLPLSPGLYDMESRQALCGMGTLWGYQRA